MSAAVGSGQTELAALDDALLIIGAADLNLVRLSSVIPPASLVTKHVGAIRSPVGAWGDTVVDRPICALVLCAFESEAGLSSVPANRRQAAVADELQTC